MKYRIWIHYDTGVEVTVNAKDDHEALKLAVQKAETMNDKKFNDQILDNLQAGSPDIVDRE